MNGASTVRDVSNIRVPQCITWSQTEFDVCPWCGQKTPAPYVQLFGKTVRFIPYPCDCRQASGKRESYQRGINRRQPVPKRYASVIAGLDANDYANSIKDGTGLYFFGGQGLGKTAMAYAIADQLNSEGWVVELVKMDSVMMRLNDTFSTSDTQGEIITHLTKCGLLIIDDLGSERQTEGMASKLLRIIDDRCEAEKPLVVTSNYSRDELAKRLSESANKQTVKSIMSRLSQMTTPIEVTGEDRRLA